MGRLLSLLDFQPDVPFGGFLAAGLIAQARILEQAALLRDDLL
jgi:hypothetical protein